MTALVSPFDFFGPGGDYVSSMKNVSAFADEMAAQGEDSGDLGGLIDWFCGIRQRLGHHLPLQNSLIPLDILNTVMSAHLGGRELPVKSLMSQLPYSLAGLRFHYARLLDAGWIENRPSERDARIRLVIPSDRLLACYEAAFLADSTESALAPGVA